jgi:hypothetical protein
MQTELNNLLALGEMASPTQAAIDAYWIIITALVIGSAIVDWLKKRGQKDEAGSLDQSGPAAPLRRGTPAAPPPSPRPVTTSNWEEELRRLLSGEPPVTKPPPPPPPVQPVIISAPASPPVMPSPVIVKRQPPPPPVHVIRPHVEEAAEAPAVSLAKLEQSAGAYRRASQLHEAVGEHLRQVDAMTERHLAMAPVTRPRGVSSDLAKFIASLRDPGTARQAIAASIILGPPKALETE